MDKWECIAENLQKARKKCGYSYQQLADKTGLSKSTLQRYESGAIRSLPLEKAEQLAQALNITPAELLGWHELNQYKELGNLDRLRELVQADREEKCVILELKEGDPVYELYYLVKGVENPEMELKVRVVGFEKSMTGQRRSCAICSCPCLVALAMS